MGKQAKCIFCKGSCIEIPDLTRGASAVFDCQSCGCYEASFTLLGTYSSRVFSSNELEGIRHFIAENQNHPISKEDIEDLLK